MIRRLKELGIDKVVFIKNKNNSAFDPMENETERILVPKQYHTLQKAVDMAKDGAVIILAPGVYEETITISGKSVMLRSENPEDEKIVASTIIDAKGKGPVILLEGTSSTVWGITVRGGYTADKGGGIFIHGKSSSLIKGNIIEKNSTDKLGGGILISQAHAPRIVGNIIRNNKALGAAGIEAIESTVYMKGDRISGNTASGPGGGVWIQECKGVFRENVVSGNNARVGAGLYISSQSTVDILMNEFSENTSEVGAGITVLEQCVVHIIGNSFVANKAHKIGGAFVFG
ncbi:MAG: right-handed parallel beta-helix repeat-containing protein [Proteobacteria bacterium]|nr:right-handed parallel beta-helix repeat-containing protein [Pseudomonadota bacterium]MBU1582139.1 right-handed parallel beta-helix repeat-containing protein [Pseudomonadota bacterium]MBU2454380.1 right-handed parallel beta-helix repeat-containing protein [Pseudomonadota bacterium]MBU2631759.1 right-handed parallel beta-helix repeat-containing protein [Pseudomonadota bacterium]